MRTEELWNEQWRNNALEFHFTPRIIKDLKEIEFGKNFNPELESTFIFGETNTGKTLLACRIALEFLKEGYLKGKTTNFRFVIFATILSSIRDTYSNNQKSESEVINQFLQPDLLLIDDFFTNRPTDWTIDVIYRIINERYENLLPTIITSNPSLPEIEEIIQDQRITSRINRSYKLIEKQHY